MDVFIDFFIFCGNMDGIASFTGEANANITTVLRLCKFNPRINVLGILLE
jgi:hypothetical protein